MARATAKATALLLSAAVAFSGCNASYFSRKMMDSRMEASATPFQKTDRAKELALSFRAVRAVPGIEYLMGSLPGQCMLYDLARMGNENRGVSFGDAALRMFSRLSSIKSYFDSAYAKASNEPASGALMELERAAYAYSCAVGKMGMKYGKTSRFIDAFACAKGDTVHADCDVTGIIFIWLAQSKGINAGGLMGWDSTDFSRGAHFLVAVPGKGGRPTYTVSTTLLLRQSARERPPGKTPDSERFGISTQRAYADRAEHKFPGFTFWYFKPGEEINYYLGTQPLFFDKFDLPRIL